MTSSKFSSSFVSRIGSGDVERVGAKGRGRGIGEGGGELSLDKINSSFASKIKGGEKYQRVLGRIIIRDHSIKRSTSDIHFIPLTFIIHQRF
jgi:hypothetical protein